ncbi:DUF3352 domain-containing protein [Candidatus Peregrinibacteria bacterium]|nr:DUF3352 domain-containing protein [Candidatus Peregrinibacteria bacterium]
MGKKAKAKKIRREEQQQVEHPDKKSFLSKIVETGKRSGKKALPTSKKAMQIYSGLFSLIMLALLISAGYLFFQNTFRPQPIAKLLPADGTVALFEINTDFEHNQLRKSFNLLSGHPQYSRKNFISILEKVTDLSYLTEIEPWLGRQAGMALLSDKKENKIHKVYFFEYLSKKSFEEILVAEKGKKVDGRIYEIEGPRYVSLLGDYAIFADSKEALKITLDHSKSGRLYDSREYRRIDGNLPLIRTAFFYLDFSNLDGNFFQEFPFLSEKGLTFEVIQPFLKIFNAEGMSLIALEDNFAVQNFLSLDREFIKNMKPWGNKENYSANLASYVSPSSLVFWGGKNLENQMDRFTSIISGGDRSIIDDLDYTLDYDVKKYFGQETTFKKNISPLFKNEFALAVNKKDQRTIYKVLIEVADKKNDALQLHELANSFAAIGAYFEPKVVEYTLPDGTVGKEIIAVPEEIVKNEIPYKNHTIYELQLGKDDKGIYYSIFNDVAAIANDLDSVKESIDFSIDGNGSLRASPLFSQEISPLLVSTDDVSYFNIAELLPVFGMVDSVSSGRSYLDDGIGTVNYINIKK